MQKKKQKEVILRRLSNKPAGLVAVIIKPGVFYRHVIVAHIVKRCCTRDRMEFRKIFIKIFRVPT